MSLSAAILRMSASERATPAAFAFAESSAMDAQPFVSSRRPMMSGLWRRARLMNLLSLVVGAVDVLLKITILNPNPDLPQRPTIDMA